MNRIFVLGDSRTGTTSLHKFLQTAGFKSIHYYFGESGVSQGGDAPQSDGEQAESNWTILKRFIDTSGYEAFSDYPTRTYFKELMTAYPDGHFILSRRKDLETWQRSMKQFMGKFGLKLDIDALSGAHLQINQQIRDLAAETGAKLCELDIDASSAENSTALCEFLGLENVVPLGRENATASYDLRLWSKRITLFDLPEGDLISYAEGSVAPHKGMLSEYGWVFLVNDSSDFLQYLFGHKAWTSAEAETALATLRARREELKTRGIFYRKYVIPEKSVVYQEYLPKAFERLEISDQRPAQRAADAKIDGYSYPADVLRDARSHGNLYFKGDSHANWLGAYFLYHHIITTMNTDLGPPRIKQPVKLRQLHPTIAGYAGDIATQLSPEHERIVAGPWKDLVLADAFEYTTRYELPPAHRKAQPVDVPKVYLDALGERPTFRFKNSNTDLPRAVIFRDSTSDWLIELLAEHFSESLFIWHKGRVYEDIIEREKPDVVLHIQAERFFVQYSTFPAFAKLLPEGAPETGEPVEPEAPATAPVVEAVEARAAIQPALPETPPQKPKKGWRQSLKRLLNK